MKTYLASLVGLFVTFTVVSPQSAKALGCFCWDSGNDPDLSCTGKPSGSSCASCVSNPGCTEDGKPFGCVEGVCNSSGHCDTYGNSCGAPPPDPTPYPEVGRVQGIRINPPNMNGEPTTTLISCPSDNFNHEYSFVNSGDSYSTGDVLAPGSVCQASIAAPSAESLYYTEYSYKQNDITHPDSSYVPGFSTFVTIPPGKDPNTDQRYVDLYWRYCRIMDSAPTSIAPPDLACGNQSGNVTWSPVTGASRYSLRVDDLQNGWKTDPDGSCPDNPYEGDYCVDDLTTTSYRVNFLAGHSYKLWVHARNNCSGWSAPASVNYTQPVCPVTWNMTLKPVCEATGPLVSGWTTRAMLTEWDTGIPFPTPQLRYDFGSYGTGTRSLSVTSNSLSDLEYLSLQDSSGVTHQALRIVPNDPDVAFGTYLSPSIYAAKWDRNLLPAGSYTVEYKAPASYCPGPSNTPLPTLVPPQCQNMTLWRGGVNINPSDIRYNDSITYKVGVYSEQPLSKIKYKVTKNGTTTYPLVDARCPLPTSQKVYRGELTFLQDSYGSYDVRLDPTGYVPGPCLN